eukprot:3912989-Pyramimonas_sp.AAC.1
MAADAVGADADFIEVGIGGSCSKPSQLALQRVGWAVTPLGPQSDVPLRSAFAPVPSTLPQTSATAWLIEGVVPMRIHSALWRLRCPRETSSWQPTRCTVAS